MQRKAGPISCKLEHGRSGCHRSKAQLRVSLCNRPAATKGYSTNSWASLFHLQMSYCCLLWAFYWPARVNARTPYASIRPSLWLEARFVLDSELVWIMPRFRNGAELARQLHLVMACPIARTCCWLGERRPHHSREARQHKHRERLSDQVDLHHHDCLWIQVVYSARSRIELVALYSGNVGFLRSFLSKNYLLWHILPQNRARLPFKIDLFEFNSNA